MQGETQDAIKKSVEIASERGLVFKSKIEAVEDEEVIQIPDAMLEAAENIVQDQRLGYESLDEFIRESIRLNILRFIQK